ncbi:MAG TPA: LytTR family DNA-binding domain-containing protein [Chitinophagaceae bacterium]|nr:LytTR family DNA-binding domain-containing protein [Chitinophagaceae bacterium]
MIRCLLLEDEWLAREVIQGYVSRMPDLTLIASCGRVTDALPVLRGGSVDLLFLDLQLPGITGIDLLKTLPNAPLVIITSAYPEFALASFEFRVIDYLVKPIPFERFSKALKKVLDGQLTLSSGVLPGDPGEDFLVIKSRGRTCRVALREIVFVEGMRDYLKIHARTEQYLTHLTMTDMEQMLPADRFARIHKSYIVSLFQVRSLSSRSVEIGKHILPVGPLYKDRLAGRIRP